MIKIIFDSYMGPCLSPITYGPTYNNYLNSMNHEKIISEMTNLQIFTKFENFKWLI